MSDELSKVEWLRPAVSFFFVAVKIKNMLSLFLYIPFFMQLALVELNLKFYVALFQMIVANPSFVVDGVSRFDFGQGMASKETSSVILTHAI